MVEAAVVFITVWYMRFPLTFKCINSFPFLAGHFFCSIAECSGWRTVGISFVQLFLRQCTTHLILPSLHHSTECAPLSGSTPSIPRSLMMGPLSLQSRLWGWLTVCFSTISLLHSCTACASYLFMLATLPPAHLAQAAAPSSVPCDARWHLPAVTSWFCNILAVSTLNSWVPCGPGHYLPFSLVPI